MMKVDAVVSLALLLLCCAVFTFADPQGGCDFYAAINDKFIVPLDYTLTGVEHLRWKHGKSIIFSRKPNRLEQGEEKDVTKNGSLIVMHVDQKKAGTYTPEVFVDGKAMGNLKNSTLCVLGRVRKPQVTIQCLASSSITFTCSVDQPVKDVRFEWFQNNKLLKATSQTLPVKTVKEVQQDAFSCQVSNRVSSQKSSPVAQNCTQPGSTDPLQLFGVNIWIYVGGGGGVVLMITAVIVCCIWNRRKRSMRVKDEEELRLGWTNPNHHQHHHHCAPTSQPQHFHQQKLAGHTGPRQHRPKQQCSQQSPRHPGHPSSDPQPSTRRPAQGSRPVAKNGERPPPLPQPRKKTARNTRV